MNHRTFTSDRPWRRWLLAATTAACALTVVGGVAGAAAAPASAARAARQAPAMRPACPVARPGHLRCFTLYRPQAAVNRTIAAGIDGPGRPAEGLDAPGRSRPPTSCRSGRNSHQTVAVSIAFDTPRLARYLAVYRKQFGLPPCTVGQRLLPQGQSERQGLAAAGVRSGLGLGSGGHARRVDDLGRLPALQDPRGRGQGRRRSATWPPPRTPPPGSAPRSSPTATATEENGFTQTFAGAYRPPRPHHRGRPRETSGSPR